MGKLGRFACIITPMLLSVASLICLALIFAGGLQKKSETLRDLYFFRADLSNFTASVSSNSDTLSTLASLAESAGLDDDDDEDELLAALEAAVTATTSNVSDVYNVYMWNYCSGDEGSGNSSSVNITYCSSRKAAYAFDPITVWGLNSSATEDYIPDELKTGLKTYKVAEKAVFALYTVAFWLTVIEIVLGAVFALCSRWGSFLTTIFSAGSTIFTLAAAVTSTVVNALVVRAIKSALGDYGITASLGTHLLAATWLAFAFSFAAGIFWLASVCCCSGKSSSPSRAARSSEKTLPYTYERVHSPYLGGPGRAPDHDAAAAGHQMQDLHQADGLKAWPGHHPNRQQEHVAGYEPYRQV